MDIARAEMKAFTIVLLLLWTTSLLGQHNFLTQNLVFKVDQRISNKENISIRNQARFRLGYQINYNLEGRIESISLKSFFSTGKSNRSAWNTVFNYSDPIFFQVPDDEFNLKHLYLEVLTSGQRIQIGQIPTVKGVVSAAGFSDESWIEDGLRVENDILNDKGVLEIVVGNLAPRTRITPELSQFDRPNYFEVEFTAELLKNFITEVAYENFESENFARAEIRADLTQFSHHLFQISFQVLSNLDQRSTAWYIDANFLPLEMILGEANQYPLKLDLFYKYIPQNLGERGRYGEEFMGFDNTFGIVLGGRLFKNVNWFARYRSNTQATRFQVDTGVRIKIKPRLK